MFGLRRRVRIAYEPLSWSDQGDPQIEEKQERVSSMSFLHINTKMYQKITPKGVQKAEGETGVAPLGAPLAPQSDF